MGKKSVKVSNSIIKVRENKLIEKIKELLNKPDSQEFKKCIIDIRISSIKEVEGFVDEFVKRYPDPSSQESVLQILLDKIDVDDEAPEFAQLKAQCLFHKAKAIISLHKEEGREQIRLEKFTEALSLLEQANTINYKQECMINIEHEVKELITQYPNYSEAFALAEKSLATRQQDLSQDHPSILEALIVAAEVGHTIDNREIKITAMQRADEAYNMAMRIGNIGHASIALEFLANSYRSFGDSLKAEELLKESAYLKASKNPNEEATEHANYVPAVIKKHGVSDELTLKIKQKIQEPILNKIYYAAGIDKWTNKGFGGEYGVSGYLDKYLVDTLGEEFNTPEHFAIALMLCFEAINLGTMASESRNPLCAVIFVQRYPELITKILESHPEYFVDGHIVRATLPNASEYSKELLGTEVEPDRGYNAYLEAKMMPIIEERLSTTLASVVELIQTGSWTKSTETNLLHYASDGYLTYVGTLTTGQLGQNLSMVNDTVNIARILILKSVIKTIEDSASTNYAPVEVIVKQYPDLVQRVLNNHPDYILNPHIRDICEKTIATMQAEAEAAEEQKDVNDTATEHDAGTVTNAEVQISANNTEGETNLIGDIVEEVGV
ncbi:MAG: hypothetical protein Tsb006_2710 [Rickettsiaceae bacterium]